MADGEPTQQLQNESDFGSLCQSCQSLFVRPRHNHGDPRGHHRETSRVERRICDIDQSNKSGCVLCKLVTVLKGNLVTKSKDPSDLEDSWVTLSLTWDGCRAPKSFRVKVTIQKGCWPMTSLAHLGVWLSPCKLKPDPRTPSQHLPNSNSDGQVTSLGPASCFVLYIPVLVSPGTS